MIRRVAWVTLVLFWLLCPSPAAAQAAGIVVLDSGVRVDFPNRAVFTVQAESYVNIVDVRLCYQVDRMNYADVVSEGWADFTPARKVTASWTWDMSNASLPPGAAVEYWWVIEDAVGNRRETSPEVMHFNDTRFAWQTFTSTTAGGEELRLFWYSGSDYFVQELMNACREGLVGLTEKIGAYSERPIKIYVYARSSDLRGAMVFSQEWTGGVAFVDFGIIAIAIPPGALEWGKRAVVHELTHLVVRQATFGPYGQLPVWLEEGLATYNEGKLDATRRVQLRAAALKGELISVRSLCSPFSAYTEKARLSYDQSYSLVEYLLSSYGHRKMLDLLTALKEGSTYDEALIKVYGFDIDGLDTLWRASLMAEATSISKAKLHPALVAALAALATGLGLWGAVARRKRASRRAGDMRQAG